MKSVAVLMGSDSDYGTMQKCVEQLRAFGIPVDVRVLSAHRSPDETARFVKGAARRGVGVFIAAAGGAAHLAGAVAAHTTLPVIGVPIASTPLGGLDALLATVQMPPGVPVATVAIGDYGATNAAVLAAQILALGNADLAKRVAEFKAAQRASVAKKNATLQKKLKSS